MYSATTGLSDAEEALENWEQMKAEEKRRKGIDPSKASQLDGIPPDLPALMKAYKLQKKAAKVGFDWDELAPVLDKIEEELAELREAIATEGSEEQAARARRLAFCRRQCVEIHPCRSGRSARAYESQI